MVGISHDERIFSRTINATIINNQFTYSLTHGENAEEILGVFTSDRNANGTFGLQVEGFYSLNFTCIYPLISWNATKVYAPTETPVHQCTSAPVQTATAKDIPTPQKRCTRI